jgi:hypothetical protein
MCVERKHYFYLLTPRVKMYGRGSGQINLGQGKVNGLFREEYGISQSIHKTGEARI